MDTEMNSEMNSTIQDVAVDMETKTPTGFKHLGLHISKPKKILEDSPLTAMAFFLGSTRSWNYTEWNKKHAQTLRTSLAAHPILSPQNTLIHGVYLANLTSDCDETVQKAIVRMKQELQTMDTLGLTYYVHHPGTVNKGKDRQKQLQVMMDNLSLTMIGSHATVLIENMASHTRLGSTIEDLQWMITHKTPHPEVSEHRVGLCLDTAHSWGAGWNMSQWKPLKEVLITKGIWSQVKGIHLNGSKAKWNSGCDLHKNVMSKEDKIPVEFWQEFLVDEDVHSLPCITETKEPDVLMYRQKLLELSMKNK